MSKLSIHDNFIRSILSDKMLAKEYFQSFLPVEVQSLLDFQTLEQSTDTYLSKDLQKTMSDIVYICQRKGLPDQVKLCLLIEHKSYIDKNAPIQMGSYIFSSLLRQVSNKEKLSMVIPVLMYHGKESWAYHTLADIFENLEPELKSYLPNFDYVYNNLGDLDDEDVEALNNKFLVASLLALKHSFEKEWLEVNAVRLLTLTEGTGGNLQSGFIVYLFGRSGLQEDKIVTILEDVPLIIKERVMSTLDIFVEKGKKIGFEEGLEKGLARGKSEFVTYLLKNTDFDEIKIAALADVSENFVRNIQSNLTK